MSSPLLTAPSDVDLSALLDSLTLPHLQVAEALTALGPSVSVASLTRVLTGQESDDRVADVVTQLVAAGLCHLDGATCLCLPGLREAFGRPLGLGPPLTEALTGLSADGVRRIARHLGLPALGSKETTLGPVVARLGEPGVIATLLADAPDGVTDRLLNLAGCGDGPSMSASDDDYYPEAEFGPQWRPGYQEPAGQARWGFDDDHAWARHRGLVVCRRDGGWADLPAEVALVLRGPDYRAPFEPVRPAAPETAPFLSCDRQVELTDHVASAMWLRLTRLCEALLREVARKPLPRRRQGDVAAPEVKRLARSLDATVEEVRVVLTLARAGGLIVTEPSVAEAGQRDAWLAAEVPERAASLAGQLRGLARPLDCGDNQWSQPYAWPRPSCPADVTALRRTLLGALGEVAPGVGAKLETVLPTVRWDAPRAVGNDAGALPALWREAESVALLVNGSLSQVGRALYDPDEARLTEVFGQLFPPMVDEARVAADLSAVVRGLPTRRIGRVLDSLATRETEGAATSWRFTPSSVRRAFDDGATLEEVIAGVSLLSPDPLPERLTRLIGDVARRHGHLVISAVGSIIASDDAALLGELQRSPVLQPLGLRELAPGMLTAETSQGHTLELLRCGGFLPVPASQHPAMPPR